MGASFKIDLSSLYDLSDRIKSPQLRQQINLIPQTKGVVALVAQSIADNFTQEGPGWKALSPTTIRQSVNRKLRKELAGLSDKQLMQLEEQKRRARAAGSKDKGDIAYRKILRKTGLLYKSVTTPGAEHNIYKVEGMNLIWGTDLIYSGVHNYGYKHIPKREYLVIRERWQIQIDQYVLNRIAKIVMAEAFGDK